MHSPSGPRCLAAKEVPALHAHPTADRPIAPTLHGIIHRTETLSWYSFVPRASGPELVPQQPREHSQSIALSSATAGQTQPSPPTLLSSGTLWPIVGTHQAPLRHSRALLLHSPRPSLGSCSWFLPADEAIGADLAEDAVMLRPSPTTRPPNKLPAPSPALKAITTPQNCSLSSGDRAPSVQELGADYF